MAAYGFEGIFKSSLLVIASWGSAGPICNSTGTIKFVLNTETKLNGIYLEKMV